MPMRSRRTRASSMPSGAPTISASTKPVRKSSAESKSWPRNSPRVMSCQSRTSVSENGTMKAALVKRPAISQRATPAKTLSQTGAWRRIVCCTGAFPNPSFRGRLKAGTRNTGPSLRSLLWIPGSPAARAPRNDSVSFHHRVGVFPDAGVDEVLVSHRLLVGLDGSDLLHQCGSGFQLAARQAVILRRPEVDREERLERLFIHFLVVAGHRGRVCHRVGVLRILHKVGGLDQTGDRANDGVAILRQIVLAHHQRQIMAGRIGVLHRQQDVQLLALVRDLGEVIEMQDSELKPSGEQRRTRARAERDLLDLVDLDLFAAGGEHRA